MSRSVYLYITQNRTVSASQLCMHDMMCDPIDIPRNPARHAGRSPHSSAVRGDTSYSVLMRDSASHLYSLQWQSGSIVTQVSPVLRVHMHAK